ncbi:multiple sugar transport system permease protein [Aquibacillus albus]|uniref:Multiple sugar transport system permease protein n=2 Tax=Aquibacillus albus TaxID=1168171 RepID=A0ABS2MWQ1_9BACI|nr:carbohydrate ABC transporter permease [Aquibacillus albus]MBM7570203.1 multiple sugar transport system permease protein [Aquibacillus albus]
MSAKINRKTKTKTSKVRVSTPIKHLIIIALGILMLYPLIWMVSSSFKPDEEIFTNPSFWPETFTWDNYIQGWAGLSGVSFGKFFLNSIFLVTMAMIGNVLSGSMAAYAFAKLDFAFKKILFALMLMTLMLPFHVTVIPQYILFNEIDMVNTYWPLIIPKFLAVEGFFIFLMVQFIRGIPGELMQAAEIDGCGPIRMYWKLILPLALPAVITTMIFTFIWTWNDFFGQLLYLSDINKYTVALGLRMFLDAMGQNSWGAMFAMSTLSLVPLFTVFIFFQKYLIEGIATGGLKG